MAREGSLGSWVGSWLGWVLGWVPGWTSNLSSAQERPEDRLFAPAPGRSATALEVRNCSALDALADAGILTWVEALLLGLCENWEGG